MRGMNYEAACLDYLIFDIEGNNLLTDITKIHCVAIEYSSGNKALYSGSDVEDGLKALMNFKGALIGHNIMGFDIPAIRKLYPWFAPQGVPVDTMLLGCILEPESGIMSLEKWAERLKLSVQKVQNEDWSVYTPLMGQRCQADVSINHSVFKFFRNNEHFRIVYNCGALELEQTVALIHAQQVRTGVAFDIPKAIALLKYLDECLGKLRVKLRDVGPGYSRVPNVAIKNQKAYKQEVHDGIWPWRKDGAFTVATAAYFDHKNLRQVRGAYNKISFFQFNPDSADEVRSLLLSLGWKPTEWNTSRDKLTGEVKVTSPKLTEDSFASLPPGLGQDIAEYNVLAHRRRWLLGKERKSGALTTVRPDGRVSAEAFTCGTNTARYRHQGTCCNIPRVTSRLGKEMRDLFTVKEMMQMVGVDLAGIEARMLAHYLLAGNYTRAKETAALILSPDKTNDFHSYNGKQWGVSRDIAKSTLYALMYGAGAKKLANTAGKPENQGAKLKRDFYKAHPGIKELIDDLERGYNAKGWIKGLDGRPLYIRQQNRLLNTLLQNAAAIVFKRWMIVLASKRCQPTLNGSVSQVIAYHDELQFEVTPELTKAWMVICEAAALEVGKELNIKVPIEAEAKRGRSWADTH